LAPGVTLNTSCPVAIFTPALVIRGVVGVGAGCAQIGVTTASGAPKRATVAMMEKLCRLLMISVLCSGPSPAVAAASKIAIGVFGWQFE